MSRHWADAFRTDLLRLAVAAVVVSLTGLVVPGAAEAASVPLRREPHAMAVKATFKFRVKAKPRPGPRVHQVARGSRTYGRQYRSGIGRDIQNLNGVSTPSLLSGPQSTTVTSAGRITSQGGYCAPGRRTCTISQSMR